MWLLNPDSGESRRLSLGETFQDAVLVAANSNVAESQLGDQWFRGAVGCRPRRDGSYTPSAGRVLDMLPWYQERSISGESVGYGSTSFQDSIFGGSRSVPSTPSSAPMSQASARVSPSMSSENSPERSSPVLPARCHLGFR